MYQWPLGTIFLILILMYVLISGHTDSVSYAFLFLFPVSLSNGQVVYFFLSLSLFPCVLIIGRALAVEDG